MKKLFKQHYQSIINRGKITNKTDFWDFERKLSEEVNELIIEYEMPLTDRFKQEAIDCLCVISNMLQHFNVDIEAELKKNIEYQRTRK